MSHQTEMRAKFAQRVLADAEEVAQAAAEIIEAKARQAIARRGRFSIVLAGGRTPEATYKKLPADGPQWHAWEVYFGDERCLPRDHPDRNSRMVAAALTGRVPIPSNQVHEIPAEMGADSAALKYAALIGSVVFDLVVHGVGEDGHTASLFPQCVLDPDAVAVAVRDAPKPPPERVSLGLHALRNTRSALVIATGSRKTRAIEAWLEGHSGLPIERVCQDVNCTLLLDTAAAEVKSRHPDKNK